MAVSKKEGGDIIRLDEEHEGNCEGSSDYIFQRIGEPVPLKLQDFNFDRDSPPAQPLAVSEHFGAIFVAHSEGFCVAKTKDVIESAKEIKEKGSGSCIQELSVVDVPIGKVYILALATDSSMLVASVGGEIHFFSVKSLLNEEQEPSFSCSLGDSGHVKDFQWGKKMENSYVVLSSQGMLYHGVVGGTLKDVMDNVDAVAWSVKGNFIAIARKNTLSILSSKFRERFRMSLSFKSWISSTDSKCTVKVDSIKWVRRDCIILGCFQLTDDGKEDGYLIQVITSRDGKITDAASMPVVLSFSEIFSGFIDDILPFGGGPYLFLSYLEDWELALTANRKNTDEHIVLLGWSLDDEQKEAAVISLENRDNWLPRIELQENGDDNLIMGLGVDRVSFNEKVKVELGHEELRELSPYCILLCLTLEGKLIMFHFAGVAEAAVPPQSLLPDEEEDSSAVLSSEYDLSRTSLRTEEHRVEGVVLDAKSKEVTKIELNTKGGGDTQKENELKPLELNESLKSSFITEHLSHREISQITTTNQEVKSAGNLKTSESDRQHNVHPTKQNQDAEQSQLSGQNSLSLEQLSVQGFGLEPRDNSMTETQKLVVDPPGTRLTGKISSDTSTSKPSNYKDSLSSLELGKGFPGKVGSTSFQSTSSELWSSGKLLFSNDSNARYSSFTSSSIKGNMHENTGLSMVNTTHVPGSHNSSDFLSGGKVFSSKDSSASPLSSVYSSGRATQSGGQRATTGAGNVESVPAIRGSQISLQERSALGRSFNFKLHPTKENIRTSPPSGVDSELEFSKHFGNVKEMAKELDTLLSYIEKEGGFRDACTVFQKSSVLALEQGIENLSDRFRVWRNTMEVRLEEIQNLLDKTVHVLAKKLHMEGIVKQASDSQYWDLWDRQKLSPELQLKRRQILKINQDLTNQLVELESHFNTLELNKFGENSGVPTARRSFHGCLEASRHIQSLHSLYNTMNSQLAVAEQLSECLSKQMAVLNIESPSMKQKSIAKELFESIGLAYDGDSFNSPDVKRGGYSPDPIKKLPFSSCSTAIKEQFRRNPSSAMKSHEPETARRRRDSLDWSWASFEPTKTTIKRMLLQEEQPRIGTNKSSLVTTKEGRSSQRQDVSAVAGWKDHTASLPSLYTSVNKDEPPRFLAKQGIQDKPLKQTFECESTSLFRWANDHSGPSQSTPVMHVMQKNDLQSFTLEVASPSSPNTVQNNTRGTWNLATDRSNSGLTGKSDSLAVHSIPISGIKSNLQSGTPMNQTPSTSTNLPGKTLASPKKTPHSMVQGNEMTNLKSDGTAQTKTMMGSVKLGAVTPEKSFGVPKVSHSSPFPPVSVPEPAAALHGEVFQHGTVTTTIQPDNTESASASAGSPTISVPPLVSSSPPPVIPSSSIPSYSSPLTLVTAPSSSAMSFGGVLTSLKPSTDADQMVPLPSSSLASTVSILSSGPFSIQAQKTQVSPSTPSVSTNSLSQALITEPKPPVVEYNPKSDVIATSQAPLPQPKPVTVESSLKLEPSILPEPASEVSTRLASVSQSSFNNIFSAVPNAASSSQSESAVHIPFPAPLSSSGSAPDGKKESLELVTQEDEMEEEAPDTTTDLNLGSLSGFGFGSAPLPAVQKPNPFGGPFANVTANPATSPFSLTVPSGELFRPASFSFQTVQPSQQPQPTNMAFSSGFNIGATPSSTGSGFGQPAQIGPGQQALGSVLGAFGQSRQLGAGLPGTGFAPAGGIGGGGFSAAAKIGGGFGSGGGSSGTSPGGFVNTATGGGFTGVASTGGGFAGVGGFAAAASSAGGFAGTAIGGGFSAASAGGGFGAFSNKQEGGAFSAFGSNVPGSGKPPSELFTQMRK